MEQNNTLEPVILSEEEIKEADGLLDENSNEELSEGNGGEE